MGYVDGRPVVRHDVPEWLELWPAALTAFRQGIPVWPDENGDPVIGKEPAPMSEDELGWYEREYAKTPGHVVARLLMDVRRLQGKLGIAEERIEMLREQLP